IIICSFDFSLWLVLFAIEGTPDELNGGCKPLNLTHLLLASLGGLLVAAAAFAGESFLHRRKAHQGDSMGNKDQKIAPLIERKDSGRRSNLERFSHYVARQLGFEDPNECPQLCKLANAYLVKTKGYDENVYEYLVNEAEPESLYVHLLEELERCILTYFAFNWTQSSNLISQVLSDESDQKAPKLKDFVMAATRKQRFERVTKDLKVTRVFSTLVEEMKVINVGSSGESHCTEVMSPVAHNKRSPVLLLMGGGMGAGKSTVLKDILHEPFWSEAGDDAVLIEADAFKETDVIYRALSSRGHHDDMLQTAELVHQSSTDAASSLLVTALNEGRDVIMDGTLSWEPFVEQMITMARNVHKHRYRMGAGYKVNEDGTTTEEYWRKEETEPNGKQQNLKPYRIELVGVVCDAYLAVARGIRRALMVKRAVRVKSQLKSHKSFANAFPKYCELVDNARLYCTNAVGGPPRLIAWKAGNSRLLVDPEDIECLKRVSNLNPDAESIYELYSDPSLLSQPGSVWTEIVIVPSRPEVQRKLNDTIKKIEKTQAKSL
uniref:Zeta toxin domain-containing protein n=2 Tax=Brassica TaxID=3705 RepID=A0A0D3DIS6_BRAOL